MDYRIVRAEPHHLEPLPEIERQAGRLFAPYDLGEAVEGDNTSLAQFREAMEEELLWVALTPDDQPVGFAFVELLDGAAHLDELDVHPDHGRRGIGAALVETVCRWARSAHLAAVTLTTFRDIPWNAPFYEKLGFRALPTPELSEALRERVRHEAARGLDPAKRVVMRRSP